MKCDVDGIELKRRVVTSLGPGSSELKFESYMSEDFIILRCNHRDENNDFLAVQMVIIGFNPYQLNLEGMINDFSTGMYNIKTQIEYSTNLDYTSEFEIVHHNQTERILAGRFWHDAVNFENEIKEIRNGEFDMKYYNRNDLLTPCVINCWF